LSIGPAGAFAQHYSLVGYESLRPIYASVI
jgi:hypothetical protein